jgi:HPt (histidine-containing phosphotransfer) domain-containing protein
MDDYLTKPTELATLRDNLARWLGADAGLRTEPRGEAVPVARESVIDRERILELVGSASGVATVLGSVESAARRDIVALQAAIEAKDGASVRSAAHRIKGSALNLGAKRLAAAAARVERVPDRLEAKEPVAGVQALIAELELVVGAAA